MFKDAIFHFVKKVNGKKYDDKIPIKNLQIQLFRMEFEEVDAIMEELTSPCPLQSGTLYGGRKVFLELEAEELKEMLKPIHTKLKNERFVQENLHP